jgi:hypothetical protein
MTTTVMLPSSGPKSSMGVVYSGFHQMHSCDDREERPGTTDSILEVSDSHGRYTFWFMDGFPRYAFLGYSPSRNLGPCARSTASMSVST